MIICQNAVIPLYDVQMAKDFQDENSKGLSTDCKDFKKRLRSRPQVKEESEDDDINYEMRKVQTPKKKVVKILDINSKDAIKSEDSDHEEEIKKKDEISIKKEKVKYTPGPKVKKNLSTYEQMIQKNREEKMAFLQSINIEEAKIDLSKAVESKRKKPKPVKRKFKEPSTSPPVLRKSRRLANISVNFEEDELFSRALKVAEESIEGFTKKILPPVMPFKDALQDNLYESYVADVCIKETKCNAKLITYDKSDLNKITLNESNIVKITPGRITSLAWYPSLEQLVVAAGDKYGNLGVLNVNNESNPYLMGIHLGGITNLQFSPFNSVQLISSSYDGILRCGDMVQHEFNEIYNVSDETCCTYFDILSESTFLVAQRDGYIAHVDRRTSGKSFEKKHACHDYSIKTVNIHPVNRNFFVSADNKGFVRVWDLRKLQNNPVAETSYHKRVVHAAFFSPVTGNSVLTTCADDSVCIFDTSDLSKIELKQRMKHNNQTGRWLSVFRATWLPNSEECFVIGSMDFPRKIEVYDKNMFTHTIISHENLTSITSLNVFHPKRHALAGGNSSGKLFVFT